MIIGSRHRSDLPDDAPRPVEVATAETLGDGTSVGRPGPPAGGRSALARKGSGRAGNGAARAGNGAAGAGVGAAGADVAAGAGNGSAGTGNGSAGAGAGAAGTRNASVRVGRGSASGTAGTGTAAAGSGTAAAGSGTDAADSSQTRGGSARTGVGPVRPAVAGVDRAVLEEERDFLLASLRDLEAEHAAGDIGEVDYFSLRDDYTMRTATVLRALDAPPTGPHSPSGPVGSGSSGGAGSRPGRRRRRWRTGAVIAVVALFGVVAAWAVSASSGSRLASQPITGDFAGKNAPGSTPPTTAGLDPRLSQAAQLVQKGKVTDALKLYDQVLKDRPNDPEAMASEGWLIAQAGVASQRSDLVDQGLVKIVAAEKVDPSYPTAHFFRGALLYQAKNDPAGAVTELRQYLGLVDPSSPEVPTVEQMLNAAMTAAGTTAGPPSSASPPVTSPPSTLAGPSSTTSP